MNDFGGIFFLSAWEIQFWTCWQITFGRKMRETKLSPWLSVICQFDIWRHKPHSHKPWSHFIVWLHIYLPYQTCLNIICLVASHARPHSLVLWTALCRVRPLCYWLPFCTVQDEEEESSYEDLIQYLTDSTFPSTATPHQQLRIKQQSESFCIISGSLHYSKDQKRPAGSDASEPLQVLFSESLKHAAIQDAHIGRCLEFVDSHENSQLSVVTVSVLSALPWGCLWL